MLDCARLRLGQRKTAPISSALTTDPLRSHKELAGLFKHDKAHIHTPIDFAEP